MMIELPDVGREEFCHALKHRGATRGAEIGVWAGEFAEMLCRLIPELHLICVDPWMAYDAYADRKNNQLRLEAAHTDAVRRLSPYSHHIYRMTSEAAAPLVPNDSLDFVYIDGNHAEAFVRRDLELWSPKVRSGGIVAGHDYELVKKHDHVQVKPAVDAFMAEHGIREGYVLGKNKAPSYYWVKP